MNTHLLKAGTRYKTSFGNPEPAGATWDGKGVNFSVFSEHAEKVELCLFGRGSFNPEIARILLTGRSGNMHHIFVEGIRPGQLYGYRVYGPYKPGTGMRFNPSKLLIDPYAKAVTGDIKLWDVHLEYDPQKKGTDLVPDNRDSAAYMPKSVVIDSSFDWGKDSQPDIPWGDTIIYELNVKGFTALHPDIPEALRGTYTALTCPPVLDYLHSLGVTTLELMPVHQSVSERRLLENGLSNYWGYNTIGFFSPDVRFSSTGVYGEQVHEFKNMVKVLHREGFEVIIDVVYNHTAEGGDRGPTLSLKGIDNINYYRLGAETKRHYDNYSGCGNTLNTTSPAVLKLITDSLNYWVSEMHVDGFRFDLATTLFRGKTDYHRHSPFFEKIHNDPILSSVKIIAEPWDLGPNGYQVGNFPDPWSEWNDKYRIAARRFWRSDTGMLGEIAYRLSGSSDLYELRSKGPYTSINYITSHDGFTLDDLVKYEKKHNEANLENNKDGNNSPHSFNFGLEGPTKNKAINEARARQKRNFLATLLLSQGVPMLLAGDEIGRTQRGNNNSYCQDNDISWVDWNLDVAKKELLEFTKFVIALRKRHPILRRGKFFHGHPIDKNGYKDLTWFLPNGKEITEKDWRNPDLRSLGLIKAGEKLNNVRKRKNPGFNNILMILLNAAPRPVVFTIPDGKISHVWNIILDTISPESYEKTNQIKSATKYKMAARSLTVLKPIFQDLSNRKLKLGPAKYSK